VPAALRELAAGALERLGAPALASRVRGAAGSPVSESALRALRGAVAGILSGDGAGAERALGPLGLVGLRLRDAAGREVVRLPDREGASPPERWRSLEAGAARFELGLSPEPPEETAAAVALVLESLLHREAGTPGGGSDFADGWRRLGLVTADAAMEEPYRRLVRFAPQAVTVLVLGESGSGKEAVARAVHRLSPRASGPFVAVNVPAIPASLAESELFGHARGAFSGADRERRGLLEEASGGTVFFDEIGDLPPPLQSKLLRALQEREVRRVGENRPRTVDVRVVSATSRELEREVEAGRFREDLFYRLHVACVRLPPLRDRGRDALLLARHFLERYAREYGRGALRLSAEAGASILAYPWPGNVRELQNAIAQAAALAEGDVPVAPELFPEAVRGVRRTSGASGAYRARVDAHRRDLIADALERSGGNRSRAARDLGLSRQALLYLIRELKVPDRGRGER
jgi:DNA-binding NtrC family response regulator